MGGFGTPPLSGFSPNLVSALILWRSSFGLPMGKVCKFLVELSAFKVLLFHIFILFSVCSCNILEYIHG